MICCTFMHMYRMENKDGMAKYSMRMPFELKEANDVRIATKTISNKEETTTFVVSTAENTIASHAA